MHTRGTLVRMVEYHIYKKKFNVDRRSRQISWLNATVDDEIVPACISFLFINVPVEDLKKKSFQFLKVAVLLLTIIIYLPKKSQVKMYGIRRSKNSFHCSWRLFFLYIHEYRRYKNSSCMRWPRQMKIFSHEFSTTTYVPIE